MTTRKNRNWILGLIILALLAMGVYLIKNQNEKEKNEPSQEESIKIGVIAAFSGEALYFGEGTKNVITLAGEEINRNGGVNGKPLEFIFEDGKCSPKEGLNAAKKLIMQDKVKVIIGGSCSSETLAAIPLINTHHVLLFSPTASSPLLTNASPYFFRIHPSDASQGKVLAEFAYINKKWKKIGFLIEQLEFPQGVFNTFERTYTQLGGEIVKEEFPTSATDYHPYLAKLKAANPDALFLVVNTTYSFERALKQLEELNWKPPLIALDIVLADHSLIKKHQDALEGLIGAEFGINPKNPKYQHLVKAYKEKYNKDLPFPSYSQNIYDAVYLLKDGISKVGNNSDKLAIWSRTIKDWPGASGNVTVDSNGERLGAHTIKIIKNGEVVDFTENDRSNSQ